mgnify:CR=1 FL=1
MKKAIIFEDMFSLPLSSSNCNLLDETKAISIPEKKRHQGKCSPGVFASDPQKVSQEIKE